MTSQIAEACQIWGSTEDLANTLTIVTFSIVFSLLAMVVSLALLDDQLRKLSLASPMIVLA